MDSLLKDISLVRDALIQSQNNASISNDSKSSSLTIDNNDNNTITSSKIDSNSTTVPTNDKLPSLDQINQMIVVISQIIAMKSINKASYEESITLLGLTNDEDSLEKILKDLNDLKLILLSSLSQESIKNLNLPNTSSFINPDGKIESKMKGTFINPKAGFVIKTKRIDSVNSHKLFINVCSHEDIDIPSMKSRLNENGESVEGLNIPMSVGPQRSSIDKSNVDCTVVDIVVNNVVLEECNDDETGKYRDFICQLCLQYVESKYKEQLDKRYKLPKLKYMNDVESPKENSTPRQQYIQDRKNMPKIEEVKTTSVANKKKTETSTKESKSHVPDIDLQYQLFWKLQDGIETAFENDALDYCDPIHSPNPEVLSISFKAIVDVQDISIKDIHLQLSSFKLKLKIPGYKQIKLFFPCSIDPTTTIFNVTKVTQGILKHEFEIQLPIDRTPWDIAPDPGSKPWLLTQALSSEQLSSTDIEIYHNMKVSNSNDSLIMTSSQSVQYPDILPEDKFHINLPDNVDKYLGLQLDENVADLSELPEDKFHKLDSSSSYINSQREQSIKDKRDKFEK